MIRVNISDIAIVAVEEDDYRYIIHDIIKSEAIHLLENSVLDDRRYIGGHVEGFQFTAGCKYWGRLTAENNFYLRLTVEKMHTFAVFTEK